MNDQMTNAGTYPSLLVTSMRTHQSKSTRRRSSRAGLPSLGVELEWTILDERDSLEPGGSLPGPGDRRRRAIPILVLTALVLLTAVALALRQRIVQNQRRLRADLQVLVNLEAHAIASDDAELFLSLQSQEDAAWFAGRETALDYYVHNSPGWPHLEVTDVELVDDYAWVHAAETSQANGERLERVLFYRRTGEAWLHAAPDVRYWGVGREHEIGPLRFSYHERDEPDIEPLAAGLTESLTPLCDDLGCSPDLSLTVQLVLPYPHGHWKLTTPQVFQFPSFAARPQPPHVLSEAASASFRRSTLAHYLAFEAAGGKKRWGSAPRYGAWLVHATANWAQARLAYGDARPSWLLHTGLDYKFLQMAVRNGRLLSLDELWRSDYFSGSYAPTIRAVEQLTDLEGVQAQAVIDYVIETYGPDAIRALLEAIARHDTLRTTLQEALGIGLGEFEAAWLAWLETYYGFGKGWRLAEALIYWEEIYDDNGFPVIPSYHDYGVDLRQYQALMRMAVQEDRALPLAELWDREKSSASTGGGVFLSTFAEPSAGPSLILDEALALQSGASSPDAQIMIVGAPDTWRSAHALAVIQYVAQVYGQGAVYDLLPASVRNDTLDGMLRDALGVGLDEFESDWRAWLWARFGDE
jgi:hypothetical protein